MSRYDWFAHHHVTWPSLACRWGRVLPEKSAHKTKQRLYYSEQTDGSCPNTLIVANADVVRPRVASAENVSRRWSETGKSPFVRKYKTIFHPGEVNKIRDIFTGAGHEKRCPPSPSVSLGEWETQAGRRAGCEKDWVATHSDCPEVFVWNIENQPNRCEKGPTASTELSRPDLKLVGHKKNAEFALATSITAPIVASGGTDNLVCLWSLADSASVLSGEGGKDGDGLKVPSGRGSWNSGGNGAALAVALGPSPTLAARAVFEGHTATVEDVAFHPFSETQLCSVGDDASLLFWDALSGKGPTGRVAQAHDDDVHCCDWSRHDDSLVITGSADKTIRMFDRRKISGDSAASALVHTFRGHSEAVSVVSFCPDQPGVFASGGKDAIVNLWDPRRCGEVQDENAAAAGPPELVFQHAGHRAEIVDLQWDPVAPWTVLRRGSPAAPGRKRQHRLKLTKPLAQAAQAMTTRPAGVERCRCGE